MARTKLKGSVRVSQIRPLQDGDILRVASLYERVARSGSWVPAPQLPGYLRRIFLECPWTDEEIPSLVCEDESGIVGFLGSHVRRASLDGGPIRLACAGQLVADRAAHNREVEALLLRRYLTGPQDVTITDSATETVSQMWEVLGGRTQDLRSVAWIRLLRPGRFAWVTTSEHLDLKRLRRLKRCGGQTSVRPALDGVGATLLGSGSVSSPPRNPHVSVEQLTPTLLRAYLPAVTEFVRAHVDYDEEYLSWLFRELASVRKRGAVVKHLVRDLSGEAIGWYVYYLKEGGTCQVLQVAAKRNHYEPVVDHLFYHAYDMGAAAISGRMEPGLVALLRRRGCLVRFRESALIHARSTAVSQSLESASFLTRMDGEWWMGHHLEPFT